MAATGTRTPQAVPDRAAAVAVGLTLALTVLLTAAASVALPSIRLVAGITVTCLLAAVALRDERQGLLATMVYLLFVAEIRRLLIPLVGWSSADPLLLVGPAILALLIVTIFVVGRRPLIPSGDRLTQMIAVLTVLALLSIVNPLAGGIAAGIGGLFYWAPQLGWYFVGRSVVNDDTLARLLRLLVWCGTAIALYGLWQAFVGHPPWDALWYQSAASTSLQVDDSVKPVGTFSSSFEYSTMLAAALCTAVALVLHGRREMLLPLPVLFFALMTSGTRTSILFAFVGIAAVVALKPREVRHAILVGAVGLVAALGGMLLVSSALSSVLGGNDLVAHSSQGLSNPLDSNDSTFVLHMQIAWEGIKLGITHPTGLGIGATNQGGAALTRDVTALRPAEIDLPNAFVALGIPGGLLYLAIIAFALFGVARLYFDGNDLALPALGVLMGGFGQWNTGGHYAMAPITFIVLAWVARGMTERRARRTPDPHRPSGALAAARRPS